ncbi:right-handed parallel beta-helix repeat-containing protein [Paraliomyxa miuraensis]|uniref:hypothetical protein n=1 Tax=Paraliomyxa miuraensis TaxID=376150 RepID=UPI0022548504|nr:hypothetical protein [Paraliomyxa miuraensis]MCX4247134.1 hypothetical protein [Paraliomyxa miuraensis]
MSTTSELETTSTDTGSAETTTDETAATSSGDTGLECTQSNECKDETRPVCDPAMGTCVACDAVEIPDQACAEANVEHPLCVDGRCVQCTAEDATVCDAQSLVCDAQSGECVPCTEHEQCGEAACNFYTGACLPGDAVVHVGGATPDFVAINAAVISFPSGTEGTIIVHPGDYNESVTVSDGRTLAFLAAELGPGVEQPRWVRSSGTSPQLTVVDATVLVDGLEIMGNASTAPPGVQLDGGWAWVDRSRIVQNNGGGILAQNGATLTLRNSFVGGYVADVDAIALNGSSLDMLYTTVAAGVPLVTNARALFCEGAATASIRNSILLSVDTVPEVECTGATLNSSATEAGVGFMASWFAGYGVGDFHLTAAGQAVFADIAQWQLGDPPTDIDGDTRPSTDGSTDYAGADAP